MKTVTRISLSLGLLLTFPVFSGDWQDAYTTGMTSCDMRTFGKNGTSVVKMEEDVIGRIIAYGENHSEIFFPAYAGFEHISFIDKTQLHKGLQDEIFHLEEGFHLKMTMLTSLKESSLGMIYSALSCFVVFTGIPFLANSTFGFSAVDSFLENLK